MIILCSKFIWIYSTVCATCFHRAASQIASLLNVAFVQPNTSSSSPGYQWGSQVWHCVGSCSHSQERAGSLTLLQTYAVLFVAFQTMTEGKINDYGVCLSQSK